MALAPLADRGVGGREGMCPDLTDNLDDAGGGGEGERRDTDKTRKDGKYEEGGVRKKPEFNFKLETSKPGDHVAD